MSHKTAATVAHTIGIDAGKNTLHLICRDDHGAMRRNMFQSRQCRMWVKS